jgi:hypothetical protein
MSQAAAGHHAHAHADHAHHAPDPAVLLAHENTHTPPGWGRAFTAVMLVVGLACLVATAAFPFIQGADAEGVKKLIKHAAASYHVGFIVTLGLILGPLGLVLIFHLVKAGWSVTLRRQLENASSQLPLAIVLALPYAVLLPYLFKWTDKGLLETDEILVHKSPWLNEWFFTIRLVFYFVSWLVITQLLTRFSREQDSSGEPSLSNRMSFHSAWGILLFALTCAFAGIDLIKTLDYHFFSTMWGVWFFAGNMVAALALMILTAAMLRRAGRLNGLVTEEHFHDMGKLLIGFTVFWAYISFSQYFLYWYANIPEETAYFVVRQHNGWEYLFYTLAFGHFIAPFLVLLFRDVKRNMLLLSGVALFLLAMHALDVFWQIRPNVYKTVVPEGAGDLDIPGKMGLSWVDLTGLLGPVCLFAAFYSRKIASGPLVPLKDPRLPEALEHKNYV